MQDAFSAEISEDALIRQANLISRTIEPRTPGTLTKAEVTEMEQCSEELQRLKLDAAGAREQCLLSHMNLKDAKGAELYERHLIA